MSHSMKLYGNKNMMESVWKNYYGDISEATCGCCGLEKITKTSIKIFKHNDSDSEVPLCKNCFKGLIQSNPKMNLLEYAQLKFSDTSLLLSNHDDIVKNPTCEVLKIYTGDNQLLVNYISSLMLQKQQVIAGKFTYDAIFHHGKIYDYANMLISNGYANTKTIMNIIEYFQNETNKHKSINDASKYVRHLKSITIDLYEKMIGIDNSVDLYLVASFFQKMNKLDIAHAYYFKILENISKYTNEQLSITYHNIGKYQEKISKSNALINYKLAIEHELYNYIPPCEFVKIIQFIIDNDENPDITKYCDMLINNNAYVVLVNLAQKFINNNDITDAISVTQKIYEHIASDILDKLFTTFMNYYEKTKKYITFDELNFVFQCFETSTITKHDVFLLKYAIMFRMELVNAPLNNVKLSKSINECTICYKSKSYSVVCCNSHKVKKSKKSKIDASNEISCNFTLCIDCYENLKPTACNGDSDCDEEYDIGTKNCPQCRSRI